MVAKRRREIAIRIAVGATPARLIQLILAESGKLAVAGAALSLVGSHYAGVLLRSYLFGIDATDQVVFVVSASVVLVVVLLATLAPTRRALDFQPFETLRED